ncbi:hypothetical protein FRACYDRAFT_232305 [Fragilariopsis cylindrus CCMP1102]|uniref:Uncharacterized protein n=1 Tax=Fragilariopsis cylindrus CCMP1102 TaxID=635003 RepID=A0A1E7FVH4_9STRA|nr:hypothetical protein FRACYDRAFT_232305 [Fragilariopsis cylindrus CCMP1102]|eukprot:OEU22152.1 hypothetical protein FRACYDRAFT_232305 [Fragilariopsis cylindrus CCMP1102]
MKLRTFSFCSGFICLIVFCQQLYWFTILRDNLFYQILKTKQEKYSRVNHNIRNITTENNINSKNYSNTTTLHASSSDSKNITTSSSTSFLIYELPKLTGQGLGNIISGILAAHRLAEEFQRTICHMGTYSSFDQAFTWKDLDHIQKCEEVLLDIRNNNSWEDHKPTSSNTIVQYNYDESSVQRNTYPRWPTNTITSSDENDDQMQTPPRKQNQPRDYFHEKFKPTSHLLDIIPWNIDNPPSIVVHLRDSDGRFDERAGLDNQTLSLLADELNNIASTSANNDANRHKKKYSNDKNKNNNHIFLVTNRVEWYDKFPGWGHPNWSLVHHSAIGRISWGRRRDKNILLTDYGKSSSKEEEALQMWADWYTLLNAKRIYHTMSDFSRSASRWNEKMQSFTIVGSTTTTTAITNMTGQNKNNTIITENPKLILRIDLQGFNESYTPRLVNRKKEDLRFCDPGAKTKYLVEKKNKELLDLRKALIRHREG